MSVPPGAPTDAVAGTEPVGAGRPIAVSCRGLSYSYGDHLAVDGVDLTIEAGEIFGLLGPNGAGKTTTIRILTTLLPMRGGEAAVLGIDVRSFPVTVRERIGYVPQQLSADAALSGWENVMLFARLFDVERSVRRDRVEEALETMGLSDSARKLAGTYSGGMIRRLELAQALVSRPEMLILDEPTIGLDPLAREGVWERVQALRSELSMTVLLTTHYMEEADVLCDHVALMHQARVRTVGEPGALKASLGAGATMDDVFRHYVGGSLEEMEEGGFRGVRSTRRTASRLG